MNQLHAIRSRAAHLWNGFRQTLDTPIDGASLAAFRICFGLVMVWHVARYYLSVGDSNVLRFLYVDVGWNFPYAGFEWVRPLPEVLLNNDDKNTVFLVIPVLSARRSRADRCPWRRPVRRVVARSSLCGDRSFFR